MPAESQLFAQLRKLLTRPPTAQRWWSLCLLLEHWPAEQGLSLGLEYASKHLEGWPESLRVPLCTWHPDHPAWSLACSNQPRFSRASSALAVWCPPGSFRMGATEGDDESSANELPATEVSLTRGFWMQATPVTQGEWESIMGNNPSCFAGTNNPVENVSWYDAVAYCNALSRLEGLEESFLLRAMHGKPGDGQGYDGGFLAEVTWRGWDNMGITLPTEAEWEYAARAGLEAPRYGEIREIAVIRGESGGSTEPVGQKQPNEWGLHDQLGNVWEWCLDSWQERLRGGKQVDPVVLDDRSGPEWSEKVVRGGAWSFSPRQLRVSARHWHKAHRRYNGVGFRPIRRIQ